MVYDDVVKPAINGTTNAKHGGGVVLTPGINVDQVIDGGKLKPIAVEETGLTDRFDDIDYYMDAPDSSSPSSITRGPGTIIQLGDFEVNWTNVNNALSSNDTYCTSSLFYAGPESDTLRASNFGFTVPVLATILGVVVRIERKSSAANSVQDVEITIRKGTTNSNNKSAAAFWSTTEGYVSFGGQTDLWGLTLTPTEVNDSSFAVNIRAGNGGIDPGVAYIDYIEVIVYYQ